MDILKEKEKFLIQRIANAAIKASMGRKAIFYNEEYNQINSTRTKKDIKTNIRKEWISLLIDKAKSFKERQEPEIFIDDVDYINKTMVGKYHQYCNFCLAHAQKSFSLFLKYLWCMEMIPEPPACPIDNIVVNETPILDKKGNLVKWTKLTELNDYSEWLNKIRETAKDKGFPSMAQWELKVWNDKNR